VKLSSDVKEALVIQKGDDQNSKVDSPNTKPKVNSGGKSKFAALARAVVRFDDKKKRT